jgi:hypothetical protein
LKSSGHGFLIFSLSESKEYNIKINDKSREHCLMKKMTITRFQEECISVLDHMDPAGILITRNGKPVARILPPASPPGRLIGSLKKKIKVKGNIYSAGVTWNAES